MNASPDALGQALADRLDELGLGGHLREAGLPTYTRDDDGRAHWADPATGAPLGHDQLAEVDRMLRSQGDEPEHAVPLPLLQLARQARVRAALLETEVHTYESLAALRGTSIDATRFAVHKQASERHLLVLADEGGRTIVPAFQLDEAGDVRPDLARALTPLLAAEMDPWRLWAWLTQPAALLGGAVPAEAIRDPEETEIVVRAATHLAARVVSDPR